MSVRENVLRLNRWRLQERQDYLAGLESLLERLRNDAHRLQDEAAAAGIGLDRGDGAEPRSFVAPLIERQHKIERSVVEVESQIAEARAAVDSALQEVKHAEVALGPYAAAAVPLRVTRRAQRRRQQAPRPAPPQSRPRGV